MAMIMHVGGKQYTTLYVYSYICMDMYHYITEQYDLI